MFMVDCPPPSWGFLFIFCPPPPPPRGGGMDIFWNHTFELGVSDLNFGAPYLNSV